MNSPAYDLSTLAQNVWSAPTLSSKQDAAVQMIQAMKFKGKTDSFISQIRKMRISQQIDAFASNLMLSDHDRVIR